MIATYICSIHNVTIVTFRKSEQQLHMRVYGQLTGIGCILNNEKKNSVGPLYVNTRNINCNVHKIRFIILLRLHALYVILC